MSNAYAIAAVTATIRSLLTSRMDVADVSTRPPDKLVNGDQNDRLNLFLYQVSPNAAWRNQTMPNVRPGEHGFPPLALDLHYLLTAYGNDTENINEQILLGQAMSILHDHALLGKNEIEDATIENRELRHSDLHQQIERIRITPHHISLDEMSKLWNTFQTQYRVSTAYQASVVLIESTRTPKTALPVVRRGERDRGVYVDVGLDPILNDLEHFVERIEHSMPYAEVPSRLVISGSNLPIHNGLVVFRDPKLKPTLENPDRGVIAKLKPLKQSTPDRIELDLKLSDGDWTAGLLSVSIEFPRNTDETDESGKKKPRIGNSNALPLPLSPKLQKRGNSLRTIVTSENGRRIIRVLCEPRLGTDRDVVLLLNSANATYQIPRFEESPSNSDTGPVFDIDDVETGNYRVRIRIEGVDSMPFVTDPKTKRASFDDEQRIQL